MAWQRNIPFGYEMRNGTIIANGPEESAVHEIFTAYLCGSSYSEIAERMERQGILYHRHTPHWNKHMVKRILENERYLGKDGYPALIDSADFNAVQRRKAAANTYAPCPADIQRIRKKMVCAVCGGSLRRRTARQGRQYWRCDDPACGQRFCVPDKAIVNRVHAMLLQLADHPERIGSGAAEPIHSPDLLRIRNELNYAMNRPDTSPDYMKALALAAAAERYKEIPDPTPARELERLRERLASRQPEDGDLWDLLEKAVRAVRVHPDGRIELDLINGEKFNGEEAAK